MPSAKATIDLKVSPETVWQLIGGFGSLADWLPSIAESKLTDGGLLRHLANPDGDVIVERLEKYDYAGKSYSYSILESPFPVAEYYATLSVTGARGGQGAHVEWKATFVPVGVSDEKVEKLFGRLFSHGLAALASRYESA
jgi:hypothetical protein